MHRLDDASLLDYAALTYPLFRHHLEDPVRRQKAVAVGYSVWGRPLGLALGIANAEKQEGQVLSLFVDPSCRRQGIGAALLAHLEQELASEHVRRALAVYTAHRPMTPVVEHLLAQAGWDVPSPRMSVFRFNGDAIVQLLQDPLMNPTRLPAGFAVFPWADLRPEERDALGQEQQARPFVDQALWPFHKGIQFEPVSSLGVRYNGAVIGWVITRRVDASTICFGKLFIRPAFRNKGQAVVVLAEALRRQVAHEQGRADWCAVCQVLAENAPMLRLVHRRLARHITSVTETLETFKVLQPATADSPFRDKSVGTPRYQLA